MSSPTGRPKLSVYWACSCGGCEVALVNLHEKLLEVDRHFELVFCPCLMDTKADAVASMPDGSIAITLFNGGIRTEENVEMARLMRRKSALLVAYGACAVAGGIPALANLSSWESRMRGIFLEAPSNDNPGRVMPKSRTAVPEGELELPAMLGGVRALGQVVDVDYWIPGCPPEPRQLWNVLSALIAGGPLPPRGSALGGGISSVCDECGRMKADKRIAKFVRRYELEPDPTRCLLEQGLICLGIATRDGCGALCPKVNLACAGCYGAADGALDQGAKIIAALGSSLEADVDTIADPAGTFYRYTMSGAPVRSDA